MAEATDKGRDRSLPFGEHDIPVICHAHHGPAQTGRSIGDGLGLLERRRRAGVTELPLVVIMIDEESKTRSIATTRPLQHLTVIVVIADRERA